MKAPETYAEWAAVIDAFANKVDDHVIVPAMQAGTLDWQAGVSERFAQRLIDAVNQRMSAAQDKFSTEMKRAAGDEGKIHHALSNLRKEYLNVLNAMDIPALPAEHRAKYMMLIKGQADGAQKSLEDSAKKADRSGRLLSLVKKSPVNKF